MADPNLKYSDIISTIFNTIVALPLNIDYDHGIPTDVKSNEIQTLSTGTYINGGVWTFKLTNINHGLDSIVPLTTVQSQFNSFLTSRGIDTKSGKFISTKGIMNLYTNIAAFVAARIVAVSSHFSTNPVLLYNSGSVTYPSVSVTDDNSSVTATDVNNTLLALNSSLNNIIISYIIPMSYSTTSSSSSSSCSSSSSSSSCSSSSSSSSCSSSSSSSCSSSSVFVAYFNLS